MNFESNRLSLSELVVSFLIAQTWLVGSQPKYKTKAKTLFHSIDSLEKITCQLKEKNQKYIQVKMYCYTRDKVNLSRNHPPLQGIF